MPQNPHRKYVFIGIAWIIGLHILFYLGDVSALGFYVGDLVPLVIKAVPLSILGGLLFFSVSFLRPTLLRVCAALILLPLTFAAVIYWPW